jgi:hypothetical protein
MSPFGRCESLKRAEYAFPRGEDVLRMAVLADHSLQRALGVGHFRDERAPSRRFDPRLEGQLLQIDDEQVGRSAIAAERIIGSASRRFRR